MPTHWSPGAGEILDPSHRNQDQLDLISNNNRNYYQSLHADNSSVSTSNATNQSVPPSNNTNMDATANVSPIQDGAQVVPEPSGGLLTEKTTE